MLALNNLHKYSVLTIIILVLFSQTIAAQGLFTLRGNIYNKERKAISGVIISVELNNNFTKYKSNSRGAFALNLKLDKKYRINISREGYLSKVLVVNTKVPSHQKKDSFDMFNLILLDKGDPELKKTSSLVQFYYNEITGDFTGRTIDEPTLSDINSNNDNNKQNENSLIAEKKRIEEETEKMLRDAEKIKLAALTYADSIRLAALNRNKTVDSSLLRNMLKEATKELSEDKFERFEVDKSEFDDIDKVKEIKSNIEGISKLIEKSGNDSLELKKNRLFLRKEFVKLAEYQLELDRLKALTAEDSMKIQQRESELRFMKQEMILAEQEIKNANNELKVKDLQINNKNIALAGFGVGTLLLSILIFIIYKNYKDKQKINKLLEDKNVKLGLQNDKISMQNFKIISSIKYAETIQTTILPPKKTLVKYFDSFVLYKPKDIVSGDFYWHTLLKNNNSEKHIIAVVDCTGHGVPGAFMSMIGNRLLNEIVKEKGIDKPSIILEQMNEMVISALRQQESENNDGMDIALCSIEQNNNSGAKIVFSGAKRPLHVFHKQTGELSTIKGTRKSVGGKQGMINKEKYADQELSLEKGDAIYLSSDGLFDQPSPARKRYGTSRFCKQITTIGANFMDDQLETIETSLAEFQQKEEQRDDITVLGIRI